MSIDLSGEFQFCHAICLTFINLRLARLVADPNDETHKIFSCQRVNASIHLRARMRRPLDKVKVAG